MRLPDEVLKSVCSLCIKGTQRGGQGFRYGGTAFFVALRSEVHPSAAYIYLVTARHNVDRAQRSGTDLYVRLNRRNLTAGYLKIDTPWIRPQENGVDLAIQGPYLDLSAFDSTAIPIGWAADEAVLGNEGVGIGDEVFCVGLFTQRSGAQQNQPLVRSGVIAAMPNQPLQDTDRQDEFDAYVAEIRSLGGLNGSPVFVGLNEPVQSAGTQKKRGTRIYLLGVIRSPWGLKRKEISLDYLDDELSQLNKGMALVTPARELTAVLYSEELNKERRRRERDTSRTNASALPPGAEFFGQEDFEDALKKVSRRLSPLKPGE